MTTYKSSAFLNPHKKIHEIILKQPNADHINTIAIHYNFVAASVTKT